MLKAYAREIIVGVIVTVLGGVALAKILPSESAKNTVTAPVLVQESSDSVASESFEQEPEPVVVQATPTMSGIRNPSGIIPAGSKIIVDDLMLVVEDRYKIDDSSVYGLNISFYLIVQNVGNRQKMFSYTNGSIRVLDNLGNEYEPNLGWSDAGEIMYEAKQATIEPGETFTIFSFDVTSAMAIERIPWFKGPIADGAKQLILEFDGFGPFSNFSCSIDL